MKCLNNWAFTLLLMVKLFGKKVLNTKFKKKLKILKKNKLIKLLELRNKKIQEHQKIKKQLNKQWETNLTTIKEKHKLSWTQ